MENGKGYASSNKVQAGEPGRVPAAGETGSQGESEGAGSIYAAVLNERENLSNMRNQGPTRPNSAVGNSRIPVQSMESRKTGRK